MRDFHVGCEWIVVGSSHNTDGICECIEPVERLFGVPLSSWPFAPRHLDAFNDLAFHIHVALDIFVCRFEPGGSEPQGDHGDFNANKQQVHGG